MSLSFTSKRTHSDYVLTELNASSPVIPLKKEVEVFGDSLSDSRAPQNQQTWAMKVAQDLGYTLTGTGISGDRADQMVAYMYNNRAITSTKSAAIFIGTNDLDQLDGIPQVTSVVSDDIVIEQIAANTVSGMLYCALPPASKFNARNSTKTGTWANTPSYTTIGSTSTTNGSTISQTVTGRYVSFTITSVNQVPAPGNQTLTGPTFDWTITNCVTNLAGAVGTLSNLTDPVFPGTMSTHPRITGGFLIRTYVYDTGVDGTHTIQISLVSDAGGDIYVDWFAGWDEDAVASANPVLVLGVPSFQYSVRATSFPTTFHMEDTRREVYNRQLKSNCDMFRKRFKLPVYYVDPGATPCGSTCADGLHMLANGQRWLGDTVSAAIQGEPYY